MFLGNWSNNFLDILEGHVLLMTLSVVDLEFMDVFGAEAFVGVLLGTPSDDPFEADAIDIV